MGETTSLSLQDRHMAPFELGAVNKLQHGIVQFSRLCCQWVFSKPCSTLLAYCLLSSLNSYFENTLSVAKAGDGHANKPL